MDRIQIALSISGRNWIGDGGELAGQQQTHIYIYIITCRILCPPFFSLLLHDFHSIPRVSFTQSGSFQSETSQQHDMQGAFSSSDSQQETQTIFTAKTQINDKPVVVLTDLAHCDQSLQVLVGLVRVDVVQWAAVPGVSIGGCEVNGNLVEQKCKVNNRTVKFSSGAWNFFFFFCQDYYLAAHDRGSYCKRASLKYAWWQYKLSDQR